MNGRNAVGDEMTLLDDARIAFYQKHRDQSRTGDFWIRLVDDLGLGEQVSEDARRKSTCWEPTRSNCPMLEFSVEKLIAAVPAEWVPGAERVFAGRTRSADVDARSWRTPRGASIVEIEYQFTIVLDDYVSAFDCWRDTLVSARKAVSSGTPIEREAALTEVEVGLLTAWVKLGQAREPWLDLRAIHQSSGAFLRDSDRVGPREMTMADCEAFLLGHEFAHHLAGHLSGDSGRKKREAAARILQKAIVDEHYREVVKDLTPKQMDEVTSDVTSLLAFAGYFTGHVTVESICRSMLGAVITLTSLGHTGRNWSVQDREASHPDILTRLEAVEVVSQMLIHDYVGPVVSQFDPHPLGLLEQLRSFWLYAMDMCQASENPDGQQLPRFREHFVRLLERTPTFEQGH